MAMLRVGRNISPLQAQVDSRKLWIGVKGGGGVIVFVRKVSLHDGDVPGYELN